MKKRKEIQCRCNNVKNILELGSRDLADAVKLIHHFPHARVTSFECSPVCIERCQQKLANLSEDERKRIMLVPKAVVNSEAKTTPFFMVDPALYGNVGASSLFLQTFKDRSPQDPDANRPCVQKQVEVPCVRLANFFAEHPDRIPDYVCIDLQGAEKLAIDSLGGAVISKVKFIVVEVGFNTGYAGGCNFIDVHEALVHHGFMHVWNTLTHEQLPKPTQYFSCFDAFYMRA